MRDFGDGGHGPCRGFRPGRLAARPRGNIGAGRGQGGLFESKPFDKLVSACLVDALDDAGGVVLHEHGNSALGLDVQGPALVVSSAHELDGNRVSRVLLADHLAPVQQELLLCEALASEGFACDDGQNRADVFGEFVSPLGILHGREYSIGLWVPRSRRTCRNAC